MLKEDKISDHSTIMIKSRLFSKNVDCNVYVDKVIGYSKEKFVHNLSRFEWDNLGSKSLSEKVEIFAHIVKDSISEFIKSIRVTKSFHNQWYDEELNTQRKKMDVSYKVAIIMSSATAWNRYKHERNVYSSMLCYKKRSFIEGKLNDANGDCKQTWKILKQLLKGNQSTEIASVEIDGVKETSAEKICDGLNKFLIESVELINSSINPPIQQPNQLSVIGNDILEFKFKSVSR